MKNINKDIPKLANNMVHILIWLIHNNTGINNAPKKSIWKIMQDKMSNGTFYKEFILFFYKKQILKLTKIGTRQASYPCLMQAGWEL